MGRSSRKHVVDLAGQATDNHIAVERRVFFGTSVDEPDAV